MGRKTQLVKKKNNTKKIENMSFYEVKEVEEEFKNQLETDPKYSLEVDPTGMYNLSDEQKEFIKFMIQYKSLKYVGFLMMKDLDEIMPLYKEYAVQEEIKRISLAMYARRFCSKMADLDSLGGYLTTALTDENVPIADRLSGKDKLAAVRLLMELNQLKSQMITQPEVIDVQAIEADIKNLKVDDIKLLIENSDEDDKITQKKNELISIIDSDGLLSSEEVAYLRTQTVDDLKKLAKEIQKEINKNEEQNVSKSE